MIEFSPNDRLHGIGFSGDCRGDKQAYDQLLTHSYGGIHAIAFRQLHRERHLTIRPTALVHRVYLQLAQLREAHREGYAENVGRFRVLGRTVALHLCLPH
jgi:hypothetical protein